MLYLDANTAAQTLRLSLNEGRTFLDTFTNYLIVFKSKSEGVEYAFIADVDSENNRYTTITVGTNANTPLTSSVLIVDPGQYIYTVYGQNSSTNLDPENAVVEGIVERGQLSISGSVVLYTESTTTVPVDEVIIDA